MSKTIPKTDSIRELARFWDTHDLADFEDELEVVGEEVFQRPPRDSVTVPLAPAEQEAVDRVARAQGIDATELLRRWVIEKLGAS